jgi:hypothetical protein
MSPFCLTSLCIIVDWRLQEFLNHTRLFEMPLLNQVSHVFIIANKYRELLHYMVDVLPANSHAGISNNSTSKERNYFGTEGEQGLKEMWEHSCSLFT